MKPNPLAGVEAVASAARAESPPAVDVAGRVLTTLRAHEREPAPREVWTFGFGSLALATAAAVAFWVGSADDSFLTLFGSFMTGYQ